MRGRLATRYGGRTFAIRPHSGIDVAGALGTAVAIHFVVWERLAH